MLIYQFTKVPSKGLVKNALLEEQHPLLSFSLLSGLHTKWIYQSEDLQHVL